MNSAVPSTAQVEKLHRTYCQLTGQNLSLHLERHRWWSMFLHAGFTEADLTQVVRYLQKQIRLNRRYVGALKLSNLLQLDRFEEDLHISRVQINPPPPPPPQRLLPPSCSPAEQERGRQRALVMLHELKQKLRNGVD